MGNVDNRAFGIAKHQQIGPAVEQHRTFNPITPVIVMRDAAQTGLDTADDDGDIAIGLFQSLAVDRDGSVKAFPRDVTGGIGIVIAAFSVRGVVVDHGVHVARGDAEKQIGLAERGEGFSGLPVGLREHPHPEALGFKYPTDDRHAEAGVINVAISGDNDDVAAVPPQLLHLGPGHRQPWRRPQTFCPVLAVAKE